MEEAVQFSCNGQRLYGILHIPESQCSPPEVVIIVSGGPQVRYGSHRLYVKLARHLCEYGIAVFRFDYEGMGDSEGASVEAEGSGPSIHAAIQFINGLLPGRRKIIWSLCDGATASALYASRYPDALSGMILCNPYINDNVILYKKHYYRERMFDKGFWTRVLSLQINFKETFITAAKYLNASVANATKGTFGQNTDEQDPFTPDSFLHSIQDSPIPVHFILSTNDYVAKEFHDMMVSHRAAKALKNNTNITISFINDADHTFTQPEFKESLFSLVTKALQEMRLDAAVYHEPCQKGRKVHYK